jgi:hypothetical protein
MVSIISEHPYSSPYFSTDLSDRIPVRHIKTQTRFYGLGTWLGFCGGFLMAYERGASKSFYDPTSFLCELCELKFSIRSPLMLYIDRFLGWSENEREQKMQHEEFTQIARSGE